MDNFSQLSPSHNWWRKLAKMKLFITIIIENEAKNFDWEGNYFADLATTVHISCNMQIHIHLCKMSNCHNPAFSIYQKE